MDDADLRLAAVEKVILALTPWIDETVIADAVATLQTEFATAQGQEREAVAYALELVTDGRDRFRKPFSLALFVRGLG